MPGPELIDAVLERLGFSDRPGPDRAGLDAVYLAWCRRVPFDNLVKRIHLVSGSADPFPNGPPDAFLGAYARDGTGGTCWPSSGGLHALLVELGFDARRGSAAMYDNLSGPIHTHGTVIVPLPLVPGGETHRDDALKPVRSEPVDGLWRVWWTGSGDGERMSPARRRRNRRALPRALRVVTRLESVQPRRVRDPQHR